MRLDTSVILDSYIMMVFSCFVAVKRCIKVSHISESNKPLYHIECLWFSYSKLSCVYMSSESTNIHPYNHFISIYIVLKHLLKKKIVRFALNCYITATLTSRSAQLSLFICLSCQWRKKTKCFQIIVQSNTPLSHHWKPPLLLFST